MQRVGRKSQVEAAARRRELAPQARFAGQKRRHSAMPKRQEQVPFVGMAALKMAEIKMAGASFVHPSWSVGGTLLAQCLAQFRLTQFGLCWLLGRAGPGCPAGEAGLPPLRRVRNCRKLKNEPISKAAVWSLTTGPESECINYYKTNI